MKLKVVLTHRSCEHDFEPGNLSSSSSKSNAAKLVIIEAIYALMYLTEILKAHVTQHFCCPLVAPI